MNLSILAIDPGASGALAVHHHDGTVQAIKMPDTPRDVCDFIDVAHSHALIHGCQIRCYMEQVWGFIGGEGMPGSAGFNFGQGYGEIIGILTHAKIPFILVTPNKWQKPLSLPATGREKGQYTGLTVEQHKAESKRVSSANSQLKRAHKARLKELAQRYYPSEKVTLSTCDALLILQYALKEERLTPAAQPQGQLI